MFSGFASRTFVYKWVFQYIVTVGLSANLLSNIQMRAVQVESDTFRDKYMANYTF